MIDTVKLQRLARRNGIETFYQLGKAMQAKGYSCSDSQAQRFWDGTTDPKLSSLDRLCEVLSCGIQEITKRPPSRNGGKRKKASR